MLQNLDNGCVIVQQNLHQPQSTTTNHKSPQQPITLQQITSDDKKIDTPTLAQPQQKSTPSCHMLQLQKLKQQLRDKQIQLDQKNQIIRHLQQRCILVGAYEQKIDKLQRKIQQLEKFLDRLERDHRNVVYANPNRNEKNKNVIIKEQNQYIVRQKSQTTQPIHNYPSRYYKNTYNNYTSSNQQRIPQTSTEIIRSGNSIRKNTIRNKQNTSPTSQISRSRSKSKSKSKSKSRSRQNNTCEHFRNTNQITKSRLLNCEKKQLQHKYRQIDAKFSQIKQNVITKSKSNKNMQEIYSILNSHKKGELALRGINQKLESILNQSVRLENSISFSRDRDRSTDLNLSFCIQSHNNSPNKQKSQWKGYSPSFTERPRTDYTGFHTLAVQNTNNQLKIPIKTQKKYSSSNYQQDIFYTPKHLILNKAQFVPQSQSQKMGNTKFKKILNATNVDQMLRVRKYFNQYAPSEIKSSYNNKSSDFILGGLERNRFSRR